MLGFVVHSALPVEQADLKKDSASAPDDSDLEKKRREAEALLQSMGITPEAPVGKSAAPPGAVLQYSYPLLMTHFVKVIH